MNRMRRKRWVSGLAIVIVTILGLASRRYQAELPVFIGAYAGDTLWATMVLLVAGFVRPAASMISVAAFAGLFSLAIEVSQFYHAPWIDSLRATRIGALILGFDFLWSDLACYAVGVLIGVAIDVGLRRLHRESTIS